MKYTWISLFLLLFLVDVSVCAQDQLPAPSIYLVTVNIETQYDSIIWHKIPAPPFDPSNDFYQVAACEERLGRPLDTFSPVGPWIQDTFFVNINSTTSSLEKPIGYTVWGIHPKGDGKWDSGSSKAVDSTMYLKFVFDSCAKTITLDWNDYNNWRGSTKDFIIFRRTGIGPYISLDTITPNTSITHYIHVLHSILPNQTYDLFVQAANTDNKRISNSNRVRVPTTGTVQTGSVNADFATISPENSIELSFTVKGAHGEDKYRLLRSDQQGGRYVTLDSISTTDTILHFIDATPFVSGIYYYKLQMLNNCNCMFTESNVANNIILAGSQSGSNVSLSWNPYADWLGGVGKYRIIRTHGQTNPLVDTLDGGILTSYMDDVSSLIDYADPSSSFICYEIDALEGYNIYGIQEHSVSNKVCFTVVPDVRMPNAFIPNDAEAVNRVFEPVFSFTPEHYELIIFNRLGTRLWEGSGPWDGKVAGKPVTEGVYLYLLRVYNYSSDVKEMNGKVVVVYR